MPLYFFDLYEPHDVVRDREGRELDDLAAAYEEAVKCARSIIAADVATGIVSLHCQIVIRGADLEAIRRVPFDEVVRINA